VSPSGGGYGPPEERDPERVRLDVVDGWISRHRAARVYGVVLGDEHTVDRDATAALRAGMDRGPGTDGADQDPVLRILEPGTCPWPTEVSGRPA
jgi:N-methylhydantoinase B